MKNGNPETVTLPAAPEGQVWRLLRSTVGFKHACGYDEKEALDFVTMADAGVINGQEAGVVTKLGNAANSVKSEGRAVQRLAVVQMAKSLMNGAMRAGGGGGPRLDNIARAYQIAIPIQLASITLPEGVTVANLAKELDKVVDLMVASTGGDRIVARKTLDDSAATFVKAMDDAEDAAKALRVEAHPETVAAIESESSPA